MTNGMVSLGFDGQPYDFHGGAGQMLDQYVGPQRHCDPEYL
jgi:hypothetical protein